MQWTARTVVATAVEASVPAGKHIGTNDDAQPDGTADDFAARNDDEPNRDHDTTAADASDAAATDDGAHGTDAAKGAATTPGRATWENTATIAAGRPAISAAAAVCKI